MSATADELYSKLPAVYRMRDAAVGHPLRALIEAWAEQIDRLEDDIGALYRNLFIETCEEWAVPYLAQLIDATLLPAISGTTLSARAQVANTLRLRRRKGTLAMIEETAASATEWTAHAEEFFQRLQTTPFLNHLTPHRQRPPDLRSPLVAARLDQPFDGTDRTVDVRRISSGRGRFNLRNIGLHLWRLRADRLPQVEAQAVPDKPGRFHLHPRRRDFPLFHFPHTEEAVERISTPLHVPEPLLRWAVYHDLQRFKEAFVAGEDATSAYFNPSGQTPALEVLINDTLIPPEQVQIADLADWDWRPPEEEPVSDSAGGTTNLPLRIALDPERGRLSIPSRRRARTVRVTFARGLPMDAGGGAYDRQASIAAWLGEDRLDWQIGVSRSLAPVADTIVATFEEAIAAWEAQPPGTVGAIFFLESSTWSPPDSSGWNLNLPPGSRLLLASAGWPEDHDALGISLGRRTGRFTPRDAQACLLAEPGNPVLSVRGTADPDREQPGELLLSGLFLGGELRLAADRLGAVTLADLRTDPAEPVRLEGTHPRAHPEFHLHIERAFVGRLVSTLEDLRAELRASLFDGSGDSAVALPEAALDCTACTFLGEVVCRTIEATDSIFRDPLVAARRQTGCIRFSFLPLNGQTPRRYRCQPDLARRDALSPAAKAQALRRVQPVFHSLDWASPWYGMLDARAPREIAQGAESGGEMGVFSPLAQQLREKALALALEDALPAPLEAGHFYAT